MSPVARWQRQKSFLILGACGEKKTECEPAVRGGMRRAAQARRRGQCAQPQERRGRPAERTGAHLGALAAAGRSNQNDAARALLLALEAAARLGKDGVGGDGREVERHRGGVVPLQLRRLAAGTPATKSHRVGLECLFFSRPRSASIGRFRIVSVS